jgi:hypothetical protein
MASHKAWDRHMITNEGLTMTNGFSTRLAKGQIGIFDMSTENQTKLGNPAVASFAGQPKDRKFEIKVGVHDNGLGRSQTNKSMTSIPFTLDGVKGLSVSVPDMEKKVYDEWLVGYNGKPGTELTFNAGETTELSILLSGEPMAILGYHNAELLLHMQFTAPQDPAEVNNEKIVLEAIKALKNEEFMGQFPIEELIEITPINSSNPASVTGTSHLMLNLKVEDLGDSGALGEVQAAYPGAVVRRSDRKGLTSTYTILVEGGDDAVAASDIKEGLAYEIVTAGDTDFTAIGAADNNVGTQFIATGAGTGTGTADAIGAVDYSYEVDGQTITKSWEEVAQGKAKTETYTIRLADKNGTDSRLSEIQAAYPELTITEVADSYSPALCQRDYQTTVATNVVFEECDPAFRDLFSSEAPRTFDFVDWEAEEVVYDANAKMGIRFKGKDVTLSPNGEALRHQFPFYNTSTRIEVSGGYPIDVNESFAHYKGGVMPIKLISRAKEQSNLGANLMDWEVRGKAYFTNGNDPKHDNLFARSIYGRESDLDELTQYVVYGLKIARSKYSQSFNGKQEENFTYHIVVEKDKHADVEALLNDLATEAGVPTVEAYPA